MIFNFGLNPFDSSISNSFLCALKIHVLSRPVIGVARMEFTLQWYNLKKHTLPSYDMNGNDLVRSW